MRNAHYQTAGRHAPTRDTQRTDRPLLLSILSETGLFDAGLSENYSLERLFDRLDQRDPLA